MSYKTGQRQFLFAIFIIAVFMFGACAPNKTAQETLSVQPELNNISSIPPTDSIEVATATAESSQTPESTPSTEPSQITTQELVYTGVSVISEIDGMEMIYIPAGVFIMGQSSEEMMALCLQEMDRESCDWYHVPDEDPVHIVNLNGFWIDKTEVTNAMYHKCVVAGVCTAPFEHEPSSIDDFSAIPKYADYPVKQVHWKQAQTYCHWAGRTLPTEAQWEKAARGVDARLYPWGNVQPTDKLASFSKLYDLDSIVPVGSYPEGASPYGLLDMAGNVAEWVADWYDETYYAISPIENPTGPESGRIHILRGGSSLSVPYDILTSTRFWISEEAVPDITNGFRCAINTSDNTATPPTFDRILSLTAPLMQGDDVKLMQQRLIELGYAEVGTPDGIFGNMTNQAVRNFQRTNAMAIDGIVGIKTWGRLFSEEAIRAK